MFLVKSVVVDGKRAVGLKVDAISPPLLLIIGEKGILSCGYFDLKIAEKFNVPVAVVRGVNSFEDMLNSAVQDLTSAASCLGVVKGDKGAVAVRKFLG